MDKRIEARISSFRDTDVEQLEKARPGDTGEKVEELLEHEDVEEAFLLQTCNRVEYYFLTDGGTPETFEETESRHLDHFDSIRHLFRVASGLESMVVGEDEILGQVKNAKEESRRGLHGTLEKVVEKAIQVGKKARRETGINEGERSVASLAAGQSSQLLEDGSSAVVIGAGDTGRKVMEHLEMDEIVAVDSGEKPEPADRMVKPGEVEEQLGEFDVMFTATSSEEPVIEHGPVPDLVFDLGNPRDVNPEIDAEVVDLDELEAVADENLETRRQEAGKVRNIIEEEMERLEREIKRKEAEDALSTIHGRSHELKQQKLDELYEKLDSRGKLDDETRELVEKMADSLVSTMLSVPTQSLKKAAEEEDWETVKAAMKVFSRGDLPERRKEKN